MRSKSVFVPSRRSTASRMPSAIDALEAAVDAYENERLESSDDVSTSFRHLARARHIVKRLEKLIPLTVSRDGCASDSSDSAFDFSKYATRVIALHIAYAGWAYHGFASQGARGKPTVEQFVFDALARTRLVSSSEDVFKTHDYARCGRTDKGVSGLGQIITLRVRSNGVDDVNLEHEIDYVSALNRALPDDIRALGWRPVDDGLSARFDCKWREYKYFFDHAEGLDLDAMREAARAFEGVHDFRNFCKMDAENVKSYTRGVFECRIELDGVRRMHYIRVRGSAFLWHQVRCMASVLFMVGLGRESPSVVAEMLDVAGATPRKPQYPMAPDACLLLWRSGYDPDRLDVSDMFITERALSQLETHVSQQVHRCRVRAAVWDETWEHVVEARRKRGGDAAALAKDFAAVNCAGNISVARAPHVPLKNRPTEDTYDERVAKIAAAKFAKLDS